MSFVEDLAPYYADFSVSANVGGVIVRGIFDNGFGNAFGVVAGSSPVLITQAAELPAVAVDQAVIINSTTYTVADIEPDGTGMVLLRLMES